MSVSAQDIVDAIDAAIYAKMNGVAWDDLTDRRLGELSITQSATMRELLELRRYYLRQVSAESGGTEETVVLL